MAHRKSKAAGPQPENPLSAGPQPTFGDVAELIRTVDDANAVRVAEAKGDMLYLRHSQIIADPHNPRTDFDDEALAELADSIATHGLMQNLVVMAEHDWTGTRHQLIAGERRWRAIGKLFDDGRWDDDALIPCKAMAGLDDEARAIQALMENLVRRDLKPLEEARAFKALRDTYGQKTDDIAGKVNRTQRFVQQRLQLLELDDDAQQRLDAGTLTIEEARYRLANRPAPIVLADEDALILSEFLHAESQLPVSTKSWENGRVPTNAVDPAERERLQNYLNFDTSWSTGMRLARRSWQFHRIEAQLAPIGPGVDGYATGWLNGPFEPDAARVAEIEATKVANAERDAERQRELDNRRAREVIARQMAEEALEPDADLALLATSGGHPLPWTFRPATADFDFAVVDAAGNEVELNDLTWAAENICWPSILVAALNRVAGHDTPVTRQPDPVDDDADDDLPPVSAMLAATDAAELEDA